ncbi:ATP-binding protein [Leptospira biflexa]|uniref:AAA family ATPase n=1 Tax=Leptospira biflexa TaxID=172 RepID=UPI0010918401|nr:ATP-binding protein [Leptospira biflexa]TGM55414.1 ATP-binding protein [Leptospira biflexa]
MDKIKSTLHFICGKMASGKTTLSKKLAKEEKAILISEDIWLQRLYPTEINTFEDYKNYSARLKTILTDHIKEILLSGVSVVLDFPANIPKTRNWIREIFESTSANHLLHVINMTDEDCLRQLHKRNLERPKGSIVMTEEEFFMVTSYYIPPTEEENFNTKEY